MRHSVIRIAALAAAITVMAALPATAGAATTGGGQFGAATLTVSVGKANAEPEGGRERPRDGHVHAATREHRRDSHKTGPRLQVDIVEAIGKKTASGTAYTSGFACDGLPHTFAMQVLAEPTSGGLHFRKGVAAVNATASASGYDANFMYGTD